MRLGVARSPGNRGRIEMGEALKRIAYLSAPCECSSLHGTFRSAVAKTLTTDWSAQRHHPVADV